MNFKEGEVLYFNKPLGWTSFKVVGPKIKDVDPKNIY